jgi:MFS transporter, DHA1 family, tetracycline resistance protein
MSNKKILWIIFLTVFIDMLGIGILIPVFPMLVAPTSSFKVTPSSWTTAEGFIMAGWLMATFPLMQFIFTPVLGQFADLYGRRKILTLSISGTAISYALFAIGIITKSIPLLFISRALDGASGGNISVAQAVIGDISAPGNLARNFGMIGIALGLGFILGPSIGGVLSSPSFISWFAPDTPFWFAAVLSAVNFILVLKLLPETLKVTHHNPIDITRPIHNIIKAFSATKLRNIIPAVFLFNAGFTFFTTFWGVVLTERFSFNQGQIGGFFAYLGVMVVLAQGLVVRRLSGKITDYKILYYSIIGAGICLFSYYFVPINRIACIYYLTPFLAIFIALTKAFSSALIIRTTPAQIRGEVMGINSSSTALANALPAILAGYIAATQTILPVLVGGVTVILGGILFIFMFNPKQQ